MKESRKEVGNNTPTNAITAITKMKKDQESTDRVLAGLGLKPAILLFGVECIPSCADPFDWSATTSSPYNGFYGTDQGTALITDTFLYDFDSSEGIYSLSIHSIKATTGGLFDILIDGVSVGTFDLYNGSTDYDVTTLVSSSIELTSGHHTLEARCIGSSGSYYRWMVHTLLLRKVG